MRTQQRKLDPALPPPWPLGVPALNSAYAEGLYFLFRDDFNNAFTITVEAGAATIETSAGFLSGVWSQLGPTLAQFTFDVPIGAGNYWVKLPTWFRRLRLTNGGWVAPTLLSFEIF